VRRPTTRLAGQQEFVFRQPLLQQAAYEMLIGEDRVLGHRLAGAWLDAHGETDSTVLSLHHERGETRAHVRTPTTPGR
jgi:eukaryotic-like serine/threonine-protein kinase